LPRVQLLCCQSDRHSILGGSNERGVAATHRSDANLADVFSRAIGIVGASLTKHAESVSELLVALDTGTDTSNLAAAAPGEWGLGLLIVGAVVALSGLVAAARWPNLSGIEPATATLIDFATSRGWGTTPERLDFRHSLQTHTSVSPAGSAGCVNGACDHHAA
jgi:hypothetical protein